MEQPGAEDVDEIEWERGTWNVERRTWKEAEMALAKDVTDLEVYQSAFDLQQRVFMLSKTFPAAEKYSLTDQVRRSSRSVGANVSEAWKKRRYPAHFVSKLTDADGEQSETCHWLRTAVASQYMASDEGVALIDQYGHVSGILNKMMRDAASWCSHYA